MNNLRKAYDEAAESNSISMRYIDAEPLYAPFSPWIPSVSLKRILLARSRVKELSDFGVRSRNPISSSVIPIYLSSELTLIDTRVLVVGKPGSGGSWIYLACNASIRLHIPCAKNWLSWDATVVLYAEEEEKRVVHIIFLQMTVREDLQIHVKGLNLVRDAIPAKGKVGDGLEIQYHYVLFLLVDDGSPLQVPKWRHVLLNSKDLTKDTSWSRDELRRYVMFVHRKELYKTFSQG